MKHTRIQPQIVYCDACGGSGYRRGCNTSPYDFNDLTCFDCGGEGQWEAEPETENMATRVEEVLRQEEE